MYVQKLNILWNLSITDTIGSSQSVLIRLTSEVVLCSHFCVAWSTDRVLIREISLF